jgi:hypothetical protein
MKRNHDDFDVKLEITTGGGATTKLELSPTTTIYGVKQDLEQRLGMPKQDLQLFHESSKLQLPNEHTIAELPSSKQKQTEAPVKLLLWTRQAEAPEVVSNLATQPNLVLRGGITCVTGLAFVPSRPTWLVSAHSSTDSGTSSGAVKIHDTLTGFLLCEFAVAAGRFGVGGIVVTADSSFVLVAEPKTHQLKVLKLIIHENSIGGNSIGASLELVHFLGGKGICDGELLRPIDVALLPSQGGKQETVLVAEETGLRVSQFAIDGTFISIFAGQGNQGPKVSSDSDDLDDYDDDWGDFCYQDPNCDDCYGMGAFGGNGEFNFPSGIAVLGLSGDYVAVSDHNNNRVQIFDRAGMFKHAFGGSVWDRSQLLNPGGLASDAHGNIIVCDDYHLSSSAEKSEDASKKMLLRVLVYSHEGTLLCARSDLRSGAGFTLMVSKALTWDPDGSLAIGCMLSSDTAETGPEIRVWRADATAINPNSSSGSSSGGSSSGGSSVVAAAAVVAASHS